MRDVIHSLALARRNRVFRRFWLGMMISRAGDAFTTVALSWLVLTTAGPRELGVTLLCFGLPRMIGAPVAGRLLDRYQPRLLLAWDNALRSALIGILALLSALAATPIAAIYVIAVCGALLSSVTEVAESALVPHLVDDADLEAANSLLAVNWELAYIVGPPLSGLLVGWTGIPISLTIDALSFVIMSVICIGLPVIDIRSPADEPAGRVSGWLDSRALLRLPAVLLLTCCTLGFLFLQGMLEVFYPVFSRDALDAGPGGYGAIAGAMGAGALLGVLVGQGLFRRLRPHTRVAAVLLGGAPLFVLLAFVDDVVVAIVVVSVASFLWGPYYVFERSLVQRLTPAHVRGRVMGARTAITSMGFPLGSAAAGVLLAALGVELVVLVMTVVYVLLAVMPLLPSVRRAVAELPKPADALRAGDPQFATPYDEA